MCAVYLLNHVLYAMQRGLASPTHVQRLYKLQCLTAQMEG